MVFEHIVHSNLRRPRLFDIHIDFEVVKLHLARFFHRLLLLEVVACSFSESSHRLLVNIRLRNNNSGVDAVSLGVHKGTICGIVAVTRQSWLVVTSRRQLNLTAILFLSVLS